jgi:hypothetical protein
MMRGVGAVCEGVAEDDDEVKEDVTLACKDGHEVEAHKVILVASNSFFQKLLKRN